MAAIASIENPILNSPYREPTRHFRFDADNQITSVIDAGRRGSSYFLPIAAPKKKDAPGLFDASEEKKEESGHVNRFLTDLERRYPGSTGGAPTRKEAP